MTELVLVLLFFAVSVSVYGAVVTLLYLRSQRLVSQTRAERFSHHQGVLADNDEAKARIFARRADEALVLTKTLQKFIPRQFVDHFAKHGTVELTLGHADEDEVGRLCQSPRHLSLSLFCCVSKVWRVLETNVLNSS